MDVAHLRSVGLMEVGTSATCALRAPCEASVLPAIGATRASWEPASVAPASDMPCVSAPDVSGALRPHVIPADKDMTRDVQCSFSCLSYNVLLPNSMDGWWIYKYYREQGDFTTWPVRQDLLRQQLLSCGADIVCLQEVSDQSFAEDFSFMRDAGFEALLHGKGGRMRPATFWKADSWELSSSHQKDRTLIVALQGKRAQGSSPLFVVNGHLSAGPNADRRLRQVHEAIECVAKEAKRLKLDPTCVPVIVCGDFNSQGVTAVRELLRTGEVGPDFRESGDPTERGQEGKQITSKVKKHTLARFEDAAEIGFDGEPPPTLLVANIDSKMLHEDGQPTQEVVQILRAVFESLSAGNGVMRREDVDRWLTRVNGEVGRGSEYRGAIAAFERRGEETLEWEDFLGIYTEEMAEGKFWGVEHDLVALRGPGGGLAKPQEGPCQLCFDHMFFTAGPLRLVGVREPLTPAQRQRIFGDPWEVLPNSWHPSDHLPVAAAFDFCH